MSRRSAALTPDTSPHDPEQSLSAMDKVFSTTELVEGIIRAVGTTTHAAHPPLLEPQPRQTKSSEPLCLLDSSGLGSYDASTPCSQRPFTAVECVRALRGVNLMFAELVDMNMTELVISDRAESRRTKVPRATPWLRVDEMCRQLIELTALETSTRPFKVRLQRLRSCHISLGTKVKCPPPASLLKNLATLLGCTKNVRRLHLILPNQFQQLFYDAMDGLTLPHIDTLVCRPGSIPLLPVVLQLRELQLQLCGESDPFRRLGTTGLSRTAANADLKGVLRLTIDNVAWEMDTLYVVRDTRWIPQSPRLDHGLHHRGGYFSSMMLPLRFPRNTDQQYQNAAVLHALDEMGRLTTLRLQPYVERDGGYTSEPGFGIFKESKSGKHNMGYNWIPPTVTEYHRIRTNNMSSGSVLEIEDDPADDDASMDTVSEASNRTAWNIGLTYAGEMLGRYTHVNKLVLGTTVVTTNSTPAVPLKIWYPPNPRWSVSSINMATSGHTTSVSVSIKRGVRSPGRSHTSDLLMHHEVRDAVVQEAHHEREKKWYKTFHNVRGEAQYREKYGLGPKEKAFKEGFDWAGWQK